MTKITLPICFVMLALVTFVSAPIKVLAKDQDANYQARIEQAKQRLNLTSEQEKDIAPILEQSGKQRIALLDKHGIKRSKSGEKKRPSFSQMMALKEDMEKLNAETREQLASILTDEQLAEWDKIQQESKEKMRKKMRSR